MAAPFLMMTVGIVVKKLIVDWVKNYAYEKGTETIIVQRIEKKLNKKWGIKFNQQFDEKQIESLREVIKEELKSYNPSSEVDQLLQDSLTSLVAGQELLLERMSQLEDVVSELSLKLAKMNHLDLPNVPEKLTEELILQYLKGDSTSEATFKEWREDGLLTDITLEILSKYNLLKNKRSQENSEFAAFLNQIQKGIDNKQLNELQLYIDLTYLLGGPQRTEEERLDSLIAEILVNPDFNKNVTAILAVLHILDRMEKVGKMDPQLQLLLAKKMYIAAQEQIDPQFRVEAFYFATKLDPTLDIPMDLIQEILEDARKEGTTGDRINKSLSLKRRILHFFTGKGYKSKQQIQVSITTLNRLLKRLEKRKFEKSTTVLLGELDRVSQELNLLSIDLETAGRELELIEIEELPNLIDALLSILENPQIQKLSLESRLKVMTCIDNAIHLQDQIAVLNSQQMLCNGMISVSSISSAALGKYKKATTDEKKAVTSELPCRQRVLDELQLPHPPKKIDAKEKTHTKKKMETN